MFPIDTFRTTLGKIIKILYKYKIRFHLTGGITSIAYSERRMTQDVDIVVDNKAIMTQFYSQKNSLSQVVPLLATGQICSLFGLCAEGD